MKTIFFLKLLCRNLNMYIIIYENTSCLILHLGKCMNCWYGKMSIFYLIFDKKIIDFYDVLKNLKMLILSCIIWEIVRKSFDKNEVENLTNFVEIRLFKVFLKLPSYKLYIWKFKDAYLVLYFWEIDKKSSWQ